MIRGVDQVRMLESNSLPGGSPPEPCQQPHGVNVMSSAPASSRKHYLREQKAVRGSHPFGVFPAQYPREILWAMNILPVEVWDPPLEVSRANAHLQPYICSVVKLGLELILQGHGGDLEGFLFPHTCDSIQNLASIVHDYLEVKKPCTFFYHPKAPYSHSARRYYEGELKALVSGLERQMGPMDPGELRRRVEQGRYLDSLLLRAYERRAKGRLLCSNHEFYRVIRQNEFLHPDDFIPLLEKLLADAGAESVSELKVILSGVLPHPRELLSLLDDLGVGIVDDDLLSCSRRLLAPPGKGQDPFGALTDRYFSLGPCSTKDSPLQERLDHVLRKVEATGAQGVIFCIVKFCEPELFDVPQLVEGLKGRGIATLVMDVELNQGLSGQMTTRVEAFTELLKQGRVEP